mmetsp:Transcript_97017/g.299038  ORF Transcript_97017/g.299038 Transcript_97017/m.299038 type:complete len:236 (-) Transcript_97017:139-846(-)
MRTSSMGLSCDEANLGPSTRRVPTTSLERQTLLPPASSTLSALGPGASYGTTTPVTAAREASMRPCSEPPAVRLAAGGATAFAAAAAWRPGRPGLALAAMSAVGRGGGGGGGGAGAGGAAELGAARPADGPVRPLAGSRGGCTGGALLAGGCRGTGHLQPPVAGAGFAAHHGRRAEPRRHGAGPSRTRPAQVSHLSPGTFFVVAGPADCCRCARIPVLARSRARWLGLGPARPCS